MSKAAQDQQSSHRRQNRFLLLLLVSAALISAAKDLGRLHDWTSGLVGFVAAVHQQVHTAVTPAVEPGCPQALPEKDGSGQPYNWNGRVAPDQLAEMKSGGGLDAVPAVSGEPLLMAIRKSGCGEIAPQIALRELTASSAAPHTWGFSMRPKTVALSRHRTANQTVAARRRNQDLRLNVMMHLPAGIEFISRLLNDQIRITLPDSKAGTVRVCAPAVLRADSSPTTTLTTSLTPNASTYTTIGRFKIFSGSALPEVPAGLPSKEIRAKEAVANCTDAITFKTTEGMLSLDLIRILRATLAGEIASEETVSEFPRTLRGIIVRPLPAAPVPPPAEDAH